MAVSHVASSAGYAATVNSFAGNFASGLPSATNTKSFNYTPTGTGNAVLIWVAIAPSSTSPTTVSLSSSGWTFSQIGGIIDGSTSGGCGAMFSAYAPNTSAAAITVTWNQSGPFLNNFVSEFSGADAATIAAGSNSATGTGTPTVSVTPTAANAMIWVACNDTLTAVGSIGGSTATKGGDDTQGDWSEYRLLAAGSGVAQSCTFTGSGSYIIGAVAIKPSTASVVNHFLSLLGCGA